MIIADTCQLRLVIGIFLQVFDRKSHKGSLDWGSNFLPSRDKENNIK